MEQRRSVYIRDARDDERHLMQDLTLSAYEEYGAVLPPQFWDVYRRRLLASLDEEGSVERIVAEHDVVIIGSVLLYPPTASAYTGVKVSTNWLELRLLAVAPSGRGQGIGTALMEECMRRARHSGATVLGLHTMDVMHAAVRLYERMDFSHVPEFDFRSSKDVLVKGYCRSLDDIPFFERNDDELLHRSS